VISSSCRDLNEEIRAGRFREDLFYRLNVVPLRMSPLSERREDIPLLCQHFLGHAAEFSGLPLRVMGEDALVAMQTYGWPGNIRQLRNVIEWLLIMAPGGKDTVIRANMLPPEVLSDGVTIHTPETNSEIMAMELREARELFERQYLAAQINRFNGNISRTSAFVGMERSALHRKLKSLNISTVVANNDEE
jgi:two-component system nitrogen regulation response regulator NtrX